MVREQLTKGLNIRISPGEMAMLDALSEVTGLSKGAMVRQLIRREHDALIGQKARPKPKRKR